MAGIIKKQILKILTKFTSGLQPEDIQDSSRVNVIYLYLLYFPYYSLNCGQLSSLKGEAELRNILLDNEALQDLLDLPTWIRINCAKVNSVSLKIQWTSLQTKPIRLLYIQYTWSSMLLSNSQSDLIDYPFRISLDHIELEAEALQEPRPPNGPSPIQDLASSNKLA